jgi:hypothetical protein
MSTRVFVGMWTVLGFAGEHALIQPTRVHPFEPLAPISWQPSIIAIPVRSLSCHKHVCVLTLLRLGLSLLAQYAKCVSMGVGVVRVLRQE